MKTYRKTLLALVAAGISIATASDSVDILLQEEVQWLNRFGFATAPAGAVQGLRIPPGYRLAGITVCGAPAPTPGLAAIAPATGISVSVPLGLDAATSSGSCATWRPLGASARFVALDAVAAPLELLTSDVASLHAIGIRLIPDETSQLWYALLHHSHVYLTGKGVGHNNVEALTGAVELAVPPTPPSVLDDSDDSTDDHSGCGKGKGKGKGRDDCK